MKIVIMLFVLVVAGCTSVDPYSFGRITGQHWKDPTLSCDLMIDGRCEYYSRTEALRPVYNELKP